MSKLPIYDTVNDLQNNLEKIKVGVIIRFNPMDVHLVTPDAFSLPYCSATNLKAFLEGQVGQLFQYAKFQHIGCEKDSAYDLYLRVR